MWIDRASAIYGLLRAPRWSRDRLRAFQASRLRRIALHAAKRIPFYEASFRSAGLDPATISSPDDVTRLPVIGKPEIQRDPQAFLPRGVSSDELIWYGTSGSTGEPMRVCRSRFEERLLQAYRIRAELLLGMRITDRRAALVFCRVPQNERRRVAPKTFLSRLGILPRFVLDSTDAPRDTIQQLRRIRPHLVLSYPGILSNVAREMSDADRAVIRPRFVGVGSEMLRPGVRKLLEDAFQAPVFDFYGAHECNLVAWQCDRSAAFHLNEDNVIVEVLRDGKPAAIGEEGDVVITTLHSYHMPFLRYRLGDIAVRGADCPCGRPFSMLASIQGRAAEVAYLPDGSKIGAIDLANVFLARPDWIRQFQIVQTRPGKLSVYIIRRRQPSQDEMDGIIREVHSISRLDLSYEFVEELPFQPSGKLPVFVSRLDA